MIDWTTLAYILATSLVSLGAAYLPILFMVKRIESEFNIKYEEWKGEKRNLTSQITRIEQDLQTNVEDQRRTKSKYNSLRLRLAEKGIIISGGNE